MQSEGKTRTYIVTVAEQAQEQPIAQTSGSYPTFTEMLTIIDNLKKCWMEKDICLTCLQDRLSELANKQNPDYSRLKVYMENKVVENDIDIEKWTTERIMAIIIMLLPMFGTAVGLGAGKLGLKASAFAFAAVLAVTGGICIWFGNKKEKRLKKRTKEMNFYKICVNILE